MRCFNSVSLATGPERKAVLNIWKVTPVDAMLTPCSSRNSPAARLEAMGVVECSEEGALMPDSLPALEVQRSQILRQIGDLRDLRPGSICAVARRCGKPTCHCAKPNDPGHDPQ